MRGEEVLLTCMSLKMIIVKKQLVRDKIMTKALCSSEELFESKEKKRRGQSYLLIWIGA